MSLSKLPRVIYWNNIPSPYMVERFDELARRNRLDFEVWFNSRIEPDRSWEVEESKWNFPYRFLPSVSIKGRVVGLPPGLLRAKSFDVLVSLYDQPSFVVGQLVARRRGIRTALWVESTFDQWVKRQVWKERMKRYIFSRADAILTPGPDGQRFAQRYHAGVDRIHIIPHDIDAPPFHRRYAASLIDRDQRRATAGLRGATYLYVGRLWSGKGLDYLLEAFKLVQRQSNCEVSLLLVGDGIDESRFRRKSKEMKLRNILFAGFKQKPELPSWYALADVFVFPTLGDPYGLVVNEAMACALPVVATTAAGEITQRISDGVNGYLVPPNDSQALADRMIRLAIDPALRTTMGAAGYERVREQSPGRWAEAFERAIEELVAPEL